jgi:hypothetical protein
MQKPEFGKPQVQITELPPELVSSRPRPVRLTGAGRLVAGLGVLLPLAALVSAFWLQELAVRSRALSDTISREGVSTAGEVVELTRTRGKDSRYFVHYTYTAGERLYLKRATVGRAYWAGLQKGSPLVVRYLPSRPEQSWLRGYEPGGVPFWAGPVVAMGLLLLTLAPWLSLRSQWMLLVDGRGALARVTRSKKMRGQHGVHYDVYYEFGLLSGSVRSGRYRSTKSPPPDGATICVVYDPDRPNRSACYPLTLVRLM